MKVEFIDEKNIVIRPESKEEQILFNMFVKMIASNKAKLATSPTYTTGGDSVGKYTALGLSLMDKEGE